MFLFSQGCLTFLSVISIAHAGGSYARPEMEDVKVKLKYGSFIGRVNNTSGLEEFFGIPFAEPPLGQLRFRNPIAPTKKYWNHNCRNPAPACPQQQIDKNPTSDSYKSWLGWDTLRLYYLKSFGPGQEDCLTLDIARPTGWQIGRPEIGLTNTTRLPVMFNIHAGGFNFGKSSQLGLKSMVAKSIELGLPTIHVSANYRLNAFGFLGGREVGQAGSGNLGLKDQRLALEWVKNHIAEFGGDPDKVTIYGSSSGAMSVSHHLLAYRGRHKGLFRAAIASSGTALPVGKLSEGAGQATFDYLVNSTDCVDSTDKLDCLREVPYKEIIEALNNIRGKYSFGAFPLTFGPAIDGEFVTESMQSALKAGRFAKVPTITGNTYDEGTLLALSTLPLHTEGQLRKFLSHRFKKATRKIINKVLELWPSDPEAGSPFASGSMYAITPVYKQYSAILGDLGFQGLRRLFLRETSRSMPTWSYIDECFINRPIVGAFHAREVPAVFGLIPGARTNDFQTRWIAFANNLEPNHYGVPDWPSYEKGNYNLIINENGTSGVLPDTFRSKEIDYYLSNIDALTFDLS